MPRENLVTILEKESKVSDPEWLRKIRTWYGGEGHSHSHHTNRFLEDSGEVERVHSIEEVLDFATKLGLQFVILADHSSDPGNPVVLSETHPICEQILSQAKNIRRINEMNPGAVAVAAVEANVFIDENGEPVIDVPNEILKELEYVVASVHAVANANYKDPKIHKKLVLAGLNNPYVDAIGHPYRYMEFSDIEYWDMWQEILSQMEETGTIFELNLNILKPNNDFYKRLIKLSSRYKNLKYSIAFDFHNSHQLTQINEDELMSQIPDTNNKTLRMRAVRKLLDTISLLESFDVSPIQVVNSSWDNLQNYFEERKMRRKLQVVQTHPEISILTNLQTLAEETGLAFTDWALSDLQYRSNSKDVREATIILEHPDRNYKATYYNKTKTGRLHEVITALNKNIPQKTLKPLLHIDFEDNGILIHEDDDHPTLADLLSKNPDINLAEEILMETAETLGKVHGINPAPLYYWINHHNSSLENIVSDVSKETLAKMKLSHPEVYEALIDLYKKLVAQEKDILRESQICLIHGDMHPGNILIAEDLLPKIGDYSQFTFGIPERDVASMIEQIYSLGVMKDLLKDHEVKDLQKVFFNSYPDFLDIDKITFYRAWTAWRNALYNYSNAYLGVKYNDLGRICLARCRQFLGNS